jgi:catechol 2,3-dioxygenase-like lactoylglutathione lyase family enzyme
MTGSNIRVGRNFRLQPVRYSLFLFGALLAQPLQAQTDRQPPKILGISHVALNVSNLKLSRLFYEGSLGFAEPYTLKHLDGTDWIVTLKVNDQQFIELFTDRPNGDGQLNHFALYTDDAKSLADQLTARGLRLVGDAHLGQTGNEFFSIRDPDGHLIEIVEYRPDGLTLQDQGRYLPPNRASDHILFVAIRTGSLTLSLRFYKDLLGFQEVSRSGPSGDQPGTVTLRVPDGKDEIHLLLYREFPPPNHSRVDNFFCLADSRPQNPSLNETVPSNPSSAAAHAQKSAEGSALFLFDPDGARIELLSPGGRAREPIAPNSTHSF